MSPEDHLEGLVSRKPADRPTASQEETPISSLPLTQKPAVAGVSPRVAVSGQEEPVPGEPLADEEITPIQPLPVGTVWPGTTLASFDHEMQAESGRSSTTWSEAQPNQSGHLGGYRILGVLGQGGMSVVYRAEDMQLQRLVALKVMSPKLAANPHARQRFLREAQAIAALEHPHVIAIYHVGEVNGLPFLAMPLLQGETLAARLKRDPILPLIEVLHIGRATAEALDAAHRRGLIHRDIKPANIWLEQSGSSPGKVKVLDFGLARPLAQGDDPSLTRFGAVLGTPGYMSPEQARGEKIDSRSDLFSLGVVLYRISTGQQPFAGRTAVALLTALAVDEPRPLREINPELPREFESLVLRLLAKDPADRISDASSIVAEIQCIETELLSRNRPETPTLQQTTRPRKLSRKVLACLTGAAVLLLAGVLAAVGWPRGPRSEDHKTGTPANITRGANSPVAKEDSRFVPTSLQLYYGNDRVLLDKMRQGLCKGQVVVIDLKVLNLIEQTGLVREAERVRAKVLCYLSISELHEDRKEAFRSFLAASAKKNPKEQGAGSLDDLVIERNAPFQSDRIDVAAGAWQAWILAEADKALAAGVHGLFLDTIDTVDVYSTKKDWPFSRRQKSIEGMIHLIRALKAHRARPFVLMNRGLNLIGESVFVEDAAGKRVPGLNLVGGHEHNPDGVLWENAFSGQDEWSRDVERNLQAVSKSGKAAVFALGYQVTLGDRATFFSRCERCGFIPAWATSSKELHKEPASSVAER
jgi:serine/threonine protein kinase/endo-alpha-1,4-polygalactosaminidase (GH114 family)